MTPSRLAALSTRARANAVTSRALRDLPLVLRLALSFFAFVLIMILTLGLFALAFALALALALAFGFFIIYESIKMGLSRKVSPSKV